MATDDLRGAATEDLPGLPPFVPQGSLGELAEVQDHLLTIVDLATTISSELGVAAAYQSASTTLFAIPPLPTEAPDEIIDAAASAITDMQNATLAALLGLDPDERFAAYTGRVQDALDTLPDWSDRYLLALRRGEVETAQALIVEITAQRQLIRAELDVALKDVADGVSGRMEELRAAVEEAAVLTTTG